jgi:hypothetical protein
VSRSGDGKANSVRYEAVKAMLLNEFLKEHRTVQELKSTVAKQEAKMAQQQSTNAEQQKAIEALTASLKEQAAQLQTVSAQIEMSKFPPQTVVNNR